MFACPDGESACLLDDFRAQFSELAAAAVRLVHNCDWGEWQLAVYKSRTVISIGYMASRFKSKLCMVLSHSPQPFDQQALTVVSLYFETRVLNHPR